MSLSRHLSRAPTADSAADPVVMATVPAPPFAGAGTSSSPSWSQASWLARLGGLARRPVFGLVRAARRVPHRPDLDPAQACSASDAGLPAVDAATLVEAHAALLDRLRRVVADDAVFERLHRPAILAVARLVHLLPASAGSHFAGCGGLLRYCLECALSCAEGAAWHVARLPAGVRPAPARQWRCTAFLAGLAVPLPAALDCVVVCDERGREWSRFDGPLEAWLDDARAARYHVHWMPPRERPAVSRAQKARLVGQVIPPASLAWLEQGSSASVRELYAVVLGDPQVAESPLADLVDAVRREVLRHDAARRAAPGPCARNGAQLEWALPDTPRMGLDPGDRRPGALGALCAPGDGVSILDAPPVAGGPTASGS